MDIHFLWNSFIIFNFTFCSENFIFIPDFVKKIKKLPILDIETPISGHFCIAKYCTEWTVLQILHCTAKYCNVQQNSALYCKILNCTAKYWTVLQNTALYFKILHCTAKYCTVMQNTALYCKILHCTAKCFKVPCA